MEQNQAEPRLDAVGTGALSSTDCIEALRRHADSFSTILDGDLMDQLHGSMGHLSMWWATKRTMNTNLGQFNYIHFR